MSSFKPTRPLQSIWIICQQIGINRATAQGQEGPKELQMKLKRTVFYHFPSHLTCQSPAIPISILSNLLLPYFHSYPNYYSDFNPSFLPSHCIIFYTKSYSRFHLRLSHRFKFFLGAITNIYQFILVSLMFPFGSLSCV